MCVWGGGGGGGGGGAYKFTIPKPSLHNSNICVNTVPDPGGALFLDQTEARRDENIFLETAPPPPSLISRSGSGTVIVAQSVCFK